MEYNFNNKLYFVIVMYVIPLLFGSCSRKSVNQVSEVNDYSAGKGQFTHSSFWSPSRGGVDFNVYLPPNWSESASKQYPLIFLLHGQGANENSFPDVLPADSLNNWITSGKLPELVLIALKGGDNTSEMQWYSPTNLKMLTSKKARELRGYCHKNFNTSTQPKDISVIGHSRGAAGALFLGFRFPEKFSSIVSCAYVSDYVLNDIKKELNKNKEIILKSGLRIKMSIGTKDRYVVNQDRRGSYLLNEYLNENRVNHKFIVLEGVSHSLSEIFSPGEALENIKFCVGTMD